MSLLGRSSLSLSSACCETLAGKMLVAPIECSTLLVGEQGIGVQACLAKCLSTTKVALWPIWPTTYNLVRVRELKFQFTHESRNMHSVGHRRRGQRTLQCKVCEWL